MNHLFHTDFHEMNGADGRYVNFRSIELNFQYYNFYICMYSFTYVCIHFRTQTTLGIWMAKCVGIKPFTIAVDLEGSDGRERGSVCMYIQLINFPVKNKELKMKMDPLSLFLTSIL